MDKEDLRKRGYDLDGTPVKYELEELYEGSCGKIVNNISNIMVFLQEDDYFSIQKEIDKLWQQVKWKKMGVKHAREIQNDILSQYYGD